MNIVHSCKDCVFACWNRPEGVIPVQTDCALGRLGPLREQDHVFEAEDEESQFFVLTRTCRSLRKKDSAWATEHAGKEVETVQAETRLKLSVVVPLDDYTKGGLRRLCNSLLAQTSKPLEVLFVCTGKVSPTKLHSTLFGLLDVNIPFRLVHVTETTPDGQPVGRGRMVDIAVSKAKGDWYAVLLPMSIDKGFVQGLHRALEERLEKFVLVLPDKRGQGLAVHVGTHRHPEVGGNEPVEYLVEGDGKEGVERYLLLTDIIEKVRWFARKQGREDYVRKPSVWKR